MNKKNKTKNKKKVYTKPAFLIVIFFIIFIFLFLQFNQKKEVSDPILNNFAKCLTEKNVKMYGAYWCPHCKNQKELFGPSFKYINYIECDLGGKQNPKCTKAGITSYPTWTYNDKKKSGELTLDELSEWTGCKIQI